MKVCIIGAGKFGARAAVSLRKTDPNVRITMVDTDESRLRQWDKQVKVKHADGIDFLVDCLKRGVAPEMIIPAVPVHVAFEWMRRDGGVPGEIALLPVPEKIAGWLPNPMHGSNGALYVSHADFQCPLNCNEPAERCTFTGKARKTDMFKLLAGISAKGYTSVVVRSRQLAPGVGGYPPQALYTARAQVTAAAGRILLSTACRCHAVVHGLQYL